MMAIELVYPFFFFFLLGFISFQKAIVSVFLLSSFLSLIEFVVFLCRLSSTDNWKQRQKKPNESLALLDIIRTDADNSSNVAKCHINFAIANQTAVERGGSNIDVVVVVVIFLLPHTHFLVLVYLQRRLN